MEIVSNKLGSDVPSPKVAAFAHDQVGGERWRQFTSPRGQLLNQSPELRNC